MSESWNKLYINRNTRREKRRDSVTGLCKFIFIMSNNRRHNMEFELRKLRNGMLKRRYRLWPSVHYWIYIWKEKE